MKKSPKIFLLAVMCAVFMFSAALSASADTGPKPSLEITLTNAPETYYLDLLVDYDSDYQNIYGEEAASLDAKMFGILQNYSEDGWHAALSHGTRAPLFGTVVPEGNVSRFSYFGVPDTFKVIVVTPDGEVKVSGIVSMSMYQETMTVDYETMTVTSDSNPAKSYILQFLSTFIPTIIIEVLLMLAFGIPFGKNIVCVLLVNFATQALLTAALAHYFITGGFSVWGLAFYALLELGIMLVEAIIYLFALKTEKRLTRVLYAVTANLVSLLAGGIMIYFIGSLIW